jgi:cell division protease FtsH
MHFLKKTILIFLIKTLLNETIDGYSPIIPTRFSFKDNDYINHLDKENLKKLEKMFYLRNNRYSPYKKIINHNENNTDSDLNQNSNKNIYINISETINNINEHFYKTFNQEVEEQKKENARLKELKKNYYKNPYNDDDDNDKDNNDLKPDTRNDPFGLYFKKQPGKNNNDDPSADYNFEVLKKSGYSFKDVGGYEKIKNELMQTADILLNSSKYRKYNLRTPKGIIFEGPPGNGKTLLAKAFSGELNISFIPVSGSEFSEKYVGVGSGRVRTLFKTAEKNKPCIIFIDEIDALARKRGNDMINSNSEKDQTLNQLLVNLDGFKDIDGIFIIGATNRIDLLDPALLRPGRIDKNIYIGNPDSNTRKNIISIHLDKKPVSNEISMDYIVEMTGGFSGAQIENLINEAMLHALRDNREIILPEDLEYIANRILSGWQSTENKYSDDIINRIIIHELGHALIGFFSKDHALLVKVILNLWSPKTPGFTLFESNDEDSNIYTKNGLLSHLMVLLGGRVAEEIFYGYSVTTGAKKDLEQAYSLAQNMILHYGMGEQTIYPDLSDQSKYLIDKEVNKLLLDCHHNANIILKDCKDLMIDCSVILKRNNILKPDDIIDIINRKYPYLWAMHDIKK